MTAPPPNDGLEIVRWEGGYTLARRRIAEGMELEVQLLDGQWVRGRFTTGTPLALPALERRFEGAGEDGEDSSALIALSPSARLRWPAKAGPSPRKTTP